MRKEVKEFVTFCAKSGRERGSLVFGGVFGVISGCGKVFLGRKGDLRMGTIVSSLSNLYYDFYEGEEFRVEKAEHFFGKCADMERRVHYIQQIYETILGSSTINETSKLLIKTRKSHAEIARYYNSLHEQEIKDAEHSAKRGRKTAALVKADISYTNRRLKRILQVDMSDVESLKDDFFSLVVYQSEMNGALWSRADDALERLKVSLNDKVIGKETFWLNIPVKEYNKELTGEEFNRLLDLIKPYFDSQKAIAQMKLNSMKKESGYLNYILRANMDTLSEIDATRRDRILSLADKENVKRFRENAEQEQEPVQENSLLRQYQESLLQFQEEAEKERQLRIKVMGKIGQMYYQTGGSLSEKQQAAVDTLGKQYEQLKQRAEDRQEKISQLETEIQKLQEQEKNKAGNEKQHSQS